MASRSSSTIGKLGASTSRRPQLVASLRPAARESSVVSRVRRPSNVELTFPSLACSYQLDPGLLRRRDRLSSHRRRDASHQLHLPRRPRPSSRRAGASRRRSRTRTCLRQTRSGRACLLPTSKTGDGVSSPSLHRAGLSSSWAPRSSTAVKVRELQPPLPRRWTCRASATAASRSDTWLAR
jgi:hypothetical protein